MARFIGVLALLALCCAAGIAHAAEPVSTGYFTSIAIGGKDAVSYHGDAARKSHKEAEGSATFVVPYKGAQWHFASRDGADRFAANPAAYAPQYNGYCANALSTEEGLVITNGAVWEFFGDRLYLFYAEAGRQRWIKGDWQAYKKQADTAWDVIVAKRR